MPRVKKPAATALRERINVPITSSAKRLLKKRAGKRGHTDLARDFIMRGLEEPAAAK